MVVRAVDFCSQSCRLHPFQKSRGNLHFCSTRGGACCALSGWKTLAGCRAWGHCGPAPWLRSGEEGKHPSPLENSMPVLRPVAPTACPFIAVLENTSQLSSWVRLFLVLGALVRMFLLKSLMLRGFLLFLKTYKGLFFRLLPPLKGYQILQQTEYMSEYFRSRK